MGFTIGKKWPKSAPAGDVQMVCDYCGVPWRKSKMRRDRANLWRCPDDMEGGDAVTLAEGNARGAQEAERRKNYGSSGRTATHNIDSDGTIDTSVYVQRTTSDDI